MKDQAYKLREIVYNLKLKENEINESQDSNQERHSRVITVTSGKGGVGKTNVAVNLAIAFSQMGLKVVVLDVDFGLSNIDVLFGITPKYSMADLIKNEKNIFEVLTDGPNNIKFISGGSGMEDLLKLKRYQLDRFMQNVSLLDKLYDIIIIDTGAGLSDKVMNFVLAADEVLLVTTPEPTSMTDAYALIKLVSIKNKHKNIKVLVNRAINEREAISVYKKLSMVSEKFLSLKLYYIGYILNDELVSKSVKKQVPFSINYPKSQIALQVKNIADSLLGLEIDNEKNENVNGFRDFVDRLVGFFNT